MAYIARNSRNVLPSLAGAGLALGMIGVAVLLVSGCSSNSPRYRAQWCANIGDAGPYECSYNTLELCRAAVAGVGGFCERNRYLADAPAPRSRMR